ncbi:hypothetical protein Ciccas_008936 [Cichlidogyrus casuarinus]|uniref:Uncharacterized protein n=1 Tax=Cichlidogyrus casuarinus TaxID=1844966 RepID=A0ABD2Q2U8_9PLAT
MSSGLLLPSRAKEAPEAVMKDGVALRTDADKRARRSTRQKSAINADEVAKSLLKLRGFPLIDLYSVCFSDESEQKTKDDMLILQVVEAYHNNPLLRASRQPLPNNSQQIRSHLLLSMQQQQYQRLPNMYALSRWSQISGRPCLVPTSALQQYRMPQQRVFYPRPPPMLN